MILQRLKELRGRIRGKVIPAYHKKQKVRWILEVGQDGRFLGFTESGADKKEWAEITAPYVKRQGATPPPYLLVDRPVYVLGVAENSEDTQKAIRRHTAYVDLTKECAEKVNHPSLNAYVTFLEKSMDRARVHPNIQEMKKADLICPRVGDTLLTQLQEVGEYWQELQETQAAEASDFECDCLLCGKRRAIAKTHPIELKLRNDRVNLITGNAAAFLSYGLEQSEIAPLCQACAREYGEALRYLLQAEEHHINASTGVWMFWTKEAIAFDPARLFTDPDPEQVRQLITAAHRGTLPQLSANQFYAIFASSNISRMVLRTWLETTVADVQNNFAEYFENQQIVGNEGEDTPLSIYALSGSLVRRFDDLPNQVAPMLIEHALKGNPLPISLVQLAVQRARSDKEHAMTRPRAALIKLVLLSQPNLKEDRMVQAELTPNHVSPAYQCGRFLALLDDIQRASVQAKATLVDRYYGSASASPASVFGVLMRNAQNHLGKLRKTKPGLHFYFDQKLAELADQLERFPRTLTMEEQGLFALGFYQQKHRSRKQNKQSDSDSDDTSSKEGGNQ